MEFPDLGKHCNESACNRLDFLPVKCDACNKVFCSTHFSYAKHACASAHRKDIQVPVCPLCGEPVPTAPGVEPDLTVGQHIDQMCKSDSKKIFTNRCNFKGCKRKELIPVTCSQCRYNFCLRHRHTADHDCKGPTISGAAAEDTQRTLAANAAEYRRSNKPTSLFSGNPKLKVSARTFAAQSHAPSTSQVQSIQGNMSEDEALARALALSIMELDESADRNRRNDTASTTAAQRNTRTVPVGGRDNQAKDKCSLS